MLKKLANSADDTIEKKGKMFFTRKFFEQEVVLFPDKKEKFGITQILDKDMRNDSFVFLPTFGFSCPAEFGDTRSAVYLTSEAGWADMDGFQSFLREVEKKWTDRGSFEFYPDSRLMPWSISGMQSGEIVYGSGSESLIEALKTCCKTIRASVTMILQGVYGEDYTKTFFIVIGSDIKGGAFNYNFIDFYLSSAPLDWTWIQWFNDALDKLSPYNRKATYYSLKPYGYFVWRSKERITIDKVIGGIGRNGFDNREWDTFEGIILSKENLNIKFHFDREKSWTPDFLPSTLQVKCPNQYLRECLASVTNVPPTFSELRAGKLTGINRPKLYMLVFEGKGWSIIAVNIWGTSRFKGICRNRK